MSERSTYAEGIATALRLAVGDTRPAIKTIAGWSGADERTAKNWLARRYGPRGDHLIALMRHSDHVLLAVLELAGRQSLARGSRVFAALANVRKAIREVESLIDQIESGSVD